MRIQQTITRIIFFVGLSPGIVSFAQVELFQPSPKHSTLSLHVHTLSFIKNNEYFNSFVQGHTLAGYQINPYLNYLSSSGITTKFGLFLQRDWATTQFFSRFSPTFTLQYKKEDTTFLIGTLDGVHHHRLLAPICDVERALTTSPETGFRICHTNKHTFIDLWLHWLILLDKSNHTPEELIAGLSCEQLLVERDALVLQLPLQVILYHLGGQGIPGNDYSLWVGIVGGRINLPISKTRFCRKLELAAYYAANQYVKQPNRPFLRGHGFYGQVTFQTYWIAFQVSYWHARGFSSENLGHPLYQSIQLTNKQVTHQETHRQLAFLHISYTYNLAQELALVLHVDPYYDINHHLLEHEAGLYIKYQPCFKLIDID